MPVQVLSCWASDLALAVCWTSELVLPVVVADVRRQPLLVVSWVDLLMLLLLRLVFVLVETHLLLGCVTCLVHVVESAVVRRSLLLVRSVGMLVSIESGSWSVVDVVVNAVVAHVVEVV